MLKETVKKKKKNAKRMHSGLDEKKKGIVGRSKSKKGERGVNSL